MIDCQNNDEITEFIRQNERRADIWHENVEKLEALFKQIIDMTLDAQYRESESQITICLSVNNEGEITNGTVSLTV